MNKRLLAASAFLIISTSISAANASSENQCLKYVQDVERHYGIPNGILYSIAMTESRRGGKPWPWTVNDRGKGMYFDDPYEALDYITQSSGALVKNIDVGCMQINTLYHGDKFSSPEALLNPKNNVWYAGKFLRKLFDRHGSWVDAIGRYNASNKDKRMTYTCKVIGERVTLGFQTVNRHTQELCSGKYRKYISKAG